MSATATRATAVPRREGWGSLRKLSSGRWQARYPAPDGETCTARTDDDKPLTFLTKTDARAWLASVRSRIARQTWEPPTAMAARRRAEADAERTRTIGFAEYADLWMTAIRTQPNRSGKKRAIGTIRSYKSKVDGYLVPELGDTPVRDTDQARIRVMTDRLDTIPRRSTPSRSSTGSRDLCWSCS